MSLHETPYDRRQSENDDSTRTSRRDPVRHLRQTSDQNRSTDDEDDEREHDRPSGEAVSDLRFADGSVVDGAVVRHVRERVDDPEFVESDGQQSNRYRSDPCETLSAMGYTADERDTRCHEMQSKLGRRVPESSPSPSVGSTAEMALRPRHTSDRDGATDSEDRRYRVELRISSRSDDE